MAVIGGHGEKRVLLKDMVYCDSPFHIFQPQLPLRISTFNHVTSQSPKESWCWKNDYRFEQVAGSL